MDMSRFLPCATLFGMALVFMSACATTKVAQAPPPPLEVPRPAPLRPGDIVNANNESKIPFPALIEDLSKADVVYVGETHTFPEDHRIQLEILKALYARNPSLELAMEMFPRGAQPVLDRWSKGRLTEDAFLKDVRWGKVWGYPFELYRGILDFARDNHIKVLALNAPSSVVSKVARKGLKSLTPRERSQIARNIDFNNPEHREYIEKQYSEHMKGSIRDFQAFYDAQLAWEETMAETLADALRSQRGAAQILVLLGNGHIKYKFGVPQRVWRRVERPYKTVMPLPVDDVSMPVDPKTADYVWVTAPVESPHAHRGVLGVMVRPLAEGKGLEVIQVAPGGAAQKAGIRDGDVIREIDGIRVTNVEGIHHAFSSGEPTHSLLLQRGGEEITVPVTISPSDRQSNSSSQ